MITLRPRRLSVAVVSAVPLIVNVSATVIVVAERAVIRKFLFWLATVEVVGSIMTSLTRKPFVIGFPEAQMIVFAPKVIDVKSVDVAVISESHVPRKTDCII